MVHFGIREDQNPFDMMEQFPSPYHRLAYFISKYKASKGEAIKDTSLGKEFGLLNLDLASSNSIPDLVQCYCELLNTNFPIRLAETGIEGYLMEFFKTHPRFVREDVQPRIADSLDSLSLFEPETAVDIDRHGEGRIPQEPEPLTIEAILEQLGFRRPNSRLFGTCAILDELATLLKELEQDSEGRMYPPNTMEISEALRDLFNLDELKTLSFELNVPFDDLAGDNQSAKVRELIGYCERRQYLGKLRDKIVAFRPHLADQPSFSSMLNSEQITRYGQEGIICARRVLTYLLSFYSRWFCQYGSRVGTEIAIHIKKEELIDTIESMYFLERLNAELYENKELHDTFFTNFVRNEVIEAKALRDIIKQIHAYQYRYLDLPIGSVGEFWIVQLPSETKRLLTDIQQFVNRLTLEKSDARDLREDESDLPEIRILPQIVVVTRRMTMQDGGVRFDCLCEDNIERTYRFNHFIRFYRQVECFFSFVKNQRVDFVQEAPSPIIMPVDAYVEMEVTV